MAFVMQHWGLPMLLMNYPWGSVYSLPYFSLHWLRICFLKAIELKPDTHYFLFNWEKSHDT